MRDTQNSNQPNGAPKGAAGSPYDGHSLGEHYRQLHYDAATLAAEIRDTTSDVERYLTDQVNRRPYTTLGVAAGIGYVLGGGLRSRLTGVLLNSATKVALALVAREVGARLAQQASATTQDTQLAKAPENNAGEGKERS